MKYERISAGDDKGIKELSVLASAIVKEHYDPIIGKEQNDYMIKMFQSEEALKKQISDKYEYFIIKNEKGESLGFIAFYPRKDDLYLSKFYLKKEERGKGTGKETFNFIIGQAKKRRLKAVTLNVNKKNGTVKIYEKMGLKKIGEERNDIGNGYYMDDFVYSYRIGANIDI